ncbi:insulin gene enhancer protein ISL-2 [Elysia marginata]|uniref:Insulin gene enhancer protein ISL-2 n=1 Tax=Elysia marginata TaxID=1093978 RepID=A0AAV4G331_9GAST|nr:insulin gene enhancer protein ISL-2 [Elysia marginata]
MTRHDCPLPPDPTQVSFAGSTFRDPNMGNEIVEINNPLHGRLAWQTQSQNGGGLSRPLQGVPMVATSPVRHEPGVNMQGQPVEVQSYQTPWKALSEFALQGDIDQPHAPFQQLMSSFDHMEPGLPSPPPHATQK